MLKQKLLSIMVICFMLFASGQVLGAQGLQSSSDNENTLLQTMQRHAEGGNAQAQERLGDAHLEGDGAEQNAEISVQWYEKVGNEIRFLCAHFLLRT